MKLIILLWGLYVFAFYVNKTSKVEAYALLYTRLLCPLLLVPVLGKISK